MHKAYHNWEASTGLYVSSGIAHESPEEPGVHLLPAYATFDEPPVCTPGKNFAVYTKGKWQLCEALPVPTRSIRQKLAAAWKAFK